VNPASEMLHGDVPLPPLLVPGTKLVARGVYVFQCPTCWKTFRYDDPYEPICTGPSENRDDHAPVVMQFLRVDPPRLNFQRIKIVP